jgi:WhiB family redox-sensing transcriptional regulator
VSPETWREWAICRQFDPEMFFREGSGKREGETAIIQAACSVCPVRVECLDYALTHEEPQYGVWGGLGEADIGRARKALGRRNGTAGRGIGTRGVDNAEAA